MEISRFPSSDLRFSGVRSQQIIASPLHIVRQLGANSNYPSSEFSQRSPSRIPFSSRESSSKLLTNGTHWLKAVPIIKVKAQQGAPISELSEENNVDVQNEMNDILTVLLRIVRPFALQTTVVQYFFILARRLVEMPHVLQGLNWLMVIKILAVYTSVACAIIYMVGINDIFDVEIDRINHPNLDPIVSGAAEAAWVIVLCLVATSLLIAGLLKSIPFLTFTFCANFLSSIYAIPPLRTKASTFGNPITNGLLQGFVFFFASFTGAGVALGLPFQMSLPMISMSIYNFIYCFTMGILKDITDIEGDSKNNIPTIATIIGARKTLLIGTSMLILNHLSAILAAVIRREAFKCSVMIPANVFSIFYVLYQAWKMDQANYAMAQSRQSYAGFARNYLAHLILLPFI